MKACLVKVLRRTHHEIGRHERVFASAARIAIYGVEEAGEAGGREEADIALIRAYR